MRFAREVMIERALAVLDEAVTACHDRPIVPSLGLRFALTFLYACSDGQRRWYDDFLRTIQDDSGRAPGNMKRYCRFAYATTCRTAIARSVGAVP